MTADAKVGLLLGLVFIVIIAFLVNGLPNFLQSATPDDIVINTITQPTGPDLVIDDRVMDTARQLQPQMPLRQTQPPQEVVLLNPRGEQVIGTIDSAQPAVVEPTVSMPEQSQAVVAVSVQPETFGAQSSPAPAVQPAPAAKARVHVVQSGETLPAVARKYYGPEEGNRRLVIHKLYQANSKVLSSPDVIRVGDKLTIPPLSDLGVAPAKPDASQGLLNKFSDVLERVGRNDQKQISEYVVQKGDSLWGIAEKTLGDGKRYHEILKANKDLIKDADDVKAGMHLRIPK
jgi:nucleoid-associated protein YgaU